MQSDEKGTFHFFHIPHGNYQLLASLTGYEPLKDTLLYLGSGWVASLKIGLEPLR